MSLAVGHYLDNMGIHAYYEQSGIGEAIVCLHTAGADCRQWKYFVDDFPDYTVICPDLPGHGKTMPLNVEESVHPSLETYADFVWELICKLRLENPVLIGCSMGGNISLIIGTKHPHDIATIVCSDGAGKTQTFAVEEILRQQQDFLGTFNRCARNVSKGRIQEITWLRRGAPREVYIGDLLAWNQHDIVDKLRRIEVPVLLIRGKEDPVVPRTLLDQTCSSIKRAQIVELDECGHFPMLENPRLFGSVVREFLSTLV
jgi:pimeloyl-ACP methyl ester carboxylesterase